MLLVGFREGVTFAGALMLTEPHRWAGGVLLYGALPFDAGVPMTRGQLAGMPVFLAHGSDDTRTPAPLQARTWDWLAKESGAPLWAERAAGGDQLAGKVVGDVGTWLADRLDHLRAHGENPVPDGDGRRLADGPRRAAPRSARARRRTSPRASRSTRRPRSRPRSCRSSCGPGWRRCPT